MSQQMLTRNEVAAVTGRPAGRVPRWAASHHIRVTRSAAGDAYPAALTRHVHREQQRAAQRVQDRMRLTRFIRNPLNH